MSDPRCTLFSLKWLAGLVSFDTNLSSKWKIGKCNINKLAEVSPPLSLPWRYERREPDLDGNGQFQSIISLKDALGSGKGGVQIWDIPNASPNCLIWPTGRGNYMRQGWVKS